MEIHINTGNGMDNREDLERWADAEIRQSLARFAEDVRRVEVHLSDVNGAKGGATDKRCLIEAHIPQHAPVAVSHQAPSLDQAFRGAETKVNGVFGERERGGVGHGPSSHGQSVRVARNRPLRPRRPARALVRLDARNHLGANLMQLAAPISRDATKEFEFCVNGL